MSTSASEALGRARSLLSAAGGPSSTQADRRACITHLLTLPSYSVYECKATFGTLVAKFFAEFEDLQDGVVDGLLDLCEDDDEKLRIIGIKGLGATAKADPKWVRGNAGVLLQLLECPPLELQYVRESLYNLLSVRPSDVIGIMADDCRGSEEETGASRRNILDFISESTTVLGPILHSGNDLKSEQVFRDGFFEVLSTTAIAETRQVLSCLMPLSTISGKNSTKEIATRYMKALTDSLHEGSSEGLTAPLIKLFAQFIDKNPPVDVRAVMACWAAHGAVILSTGLEKGNDVALNLIERLRKWIPQAMMGWANGETGGDPDWTEEKLVPRLCDTLLNALLAVWPKISEKSSVISPLETLLYSIYSLLVTKDRRRRIKAPECRALLDLSRDAGRIVSNKSSSDVRAWENIRVIAEILSDHHQKIVDVIPSWKPIPPAAPRSAPIQQKPAVIPTGPRNDRERERDSRDRWAGREGRRERERDLSPTQHRDSIKEPPRGPARDREHRRENQQRSQVSIPTEPKQIEPSQKSETRNHARPPTPELPPARKIVETPVAPPAKADTVKVRNERQHQISPVPSAIPAKRQEATIQPSQVVITQPSISKATSDTSLASRLGPAPSSNSSASTKPIPPPVVQPIPTSVVQSTPLPAKKTSPPVVVNPVLPISNSIVTQPQAASTSQKLPQKLSLAERLGPSNSMKRRREDQSSTPPISQSIDPTPRSVTTPNLLSRLGPRTDTVKPPVNSTVVPSVVDGTDRERDVKRSRSSLPDSISQNQDLTTDQQIPMTRLTLQERMGFGINPTSTTSSLPLKPLIQIQSNPSNNSIIPSIYTQPQSIQNSQSVPPSITMSIRNSHIVNKPLHLTNPSYQNGNGNGIGISIKPLPQYQQQNTGGMTIRSNSMNQFSQPSKSTSGAISIRPTIQTLEVKGSSQQYIKGAAQQSINNTTKQQPLNETSTEEGIIRRGRGFNKSPEPADLVLQSLGRKVGFGTVPGMRRINRRGVGLASRIG
ncbi:hypothetical protein M231_00302 [Tremella mesenterica]|uniref:Uncharacterized protein n=1 Tax=Tremella mesenterica TaxID=5217 RepID=A0A4Q1BW67_TREME|nr:hypothetical protein M231_00302 [Tremella mesenterica]